MDFSDLGGVPVEQGAAPDFSDLGGKPVTDDEGAAMAAGRGALRNFPLAQQAVAGISGLGNAAGLSTPDYSDELQHLTAAAETAKSQHKYAYGAGAAIGTVAPMAIPGVGEAMEAAPIMAPAVENAVQSASDVNLTKPTLKDMGTAAIAGGIGAAAGAVGQGIRAMSPSVKTLQAEATGQGTGATIRRLTGSGLLKGADPEQSLANMGQWMNDNGIAGLAKRPGDMIEAVNGIHDKSGKVIGDILDRVGKEMPIPKASLTQDLYPLVDEYDTIAPQYHDQVLGVIKKINKLSDAGKLDLPAINKIKSFVGEESKNSPALARVYGALSERVNGVLDEYGKILRDPSDRAAFDVARENYHKSSQILPILRYAVGRQDAQGVLGNSGLLGMFGLASGVAAGHPAAGAASMVGSAIGRPVANMLGRNAALTAVPYMPAIAAAGRGLNKAAQLELANALESKFGKK